MTPMHRPEGTRRGRVLVLDDEPLVRKPVAIMLAKAGYEVIEAEDGEEAITLLHSGDNGLMLDTIVCDIRMPKISGKDAIRYFRQEYPSLPIVVMTGYLDMELALSLLRDGVQDYLVKPVSKERLLAVVSRAVEQHVVLKD